MANERILISFQRTVISKTTSEYLCSKLDNDEDAEMINNIMLLQTGLKKKLKTVEANALLFKLLFIIKVLIYLRILLNKYFYYYYYY